jgi:hypothetical protein
MKAPSENRRMIPRLGPSAIGVPTRSAGERSAAKPAWRWDQAKMTVKMR